MKYGLDPLNSDGIPESIFNAYLETLNRNPGIVKIGGPFISKDENNSIILNIRILGGEDVQNLLPIGDRVILNSPLPSGFEKYYYRIIFE